MPFYEYQCENCKREHTFLQKMSDPDPSCPDCVSDIPMKKKISVSSFQLKGTGWYETDFKHK